jgi:hypothetical protein
LKSEIRQSGRDGEIRTHDFLLPKQALYQAELRPEIWTQAGLARGGDSRRELRVRKGKGRWKMMNGSASFQIQRHGAAEVADEFALPPFAGNLADLGQGVVVAVELGPDVGDFFDGEGGPGEEAPHRLLVL